MKVKEIVDEIIKGESFVIGRLTSYECTETAKGGGQEHFHVLCGKQVLDFSRWLPKGVAVSDVKRPVWARTFGVPCVLRGVLIKVDGKYLRLGFDTIEPIEFDGPTAGGAKL